MTDSIALPATLAELREGMRLGWHAGVQLYVSRGGRVLADLALGDSRPGRALRGDDLMFWRSATKPVVAVALARLRDEGRLDWDDPVARHVPEFAQNGKEEITLRHLLTHTGGLRNADVLVPETLPWEETLPWICRLPPEPRTRPGAQAAYHRSGSWFVLGEVLRRVSGRPCSQYLRTEIFQPLGMQHSWVGMPLEQFQAYQPDRLAPLFQTNDRGDEGEAFWNSREGSLLCRPGTRGRGPARDLGRFYEALLQWRSASRPPNGAGFLISPETARLMTTRQRAGMKDRTFQHVLDWGLGFLIDSKHHGQAAPYGYGPHCSEGTFGHSGAQSSCAFADPAQELVVVWICNGLPGELRHQERAQAINKAIYQDIASFASSRPVPP